MKSAAFFVLFDGQEARGPYTYDQLNSMLTSGEVTPETLFAYDGAAEWLPLAELKPPIATPPLISVPPPLPVSAIEPSIDHTSDRLLVLLKDWVESSEYCLTRQPDGYGRHVHEAGAEDIDEGLFREPYRQRYQEICTGEAQLCELMDALVAKYPHQFKSVTLTEGWKHPVRGWLFTFTGSLLEPPPVVQPATQVLELMRLFSELDESIETVQDANDPWYESAIATFAAQRFFEVLYLDPKTRRKAAEAEGIDFDAVMEELTGAYPDCVRLHYVTKRGTKVWAYRCDD